MSVRYLKLITQILLLAVLLLVPLVKQVSLYMPYLSLKAYLLRALILLALFFWLWLILKNKEYLPKFKNLLTISLVLFLLAQVITAFLGIDSFYSFFSTIIRHDGVIQYGFWVLYFLMLLSVFKEKKDWQWLWLGFILVALWPAMVAWLGRESIWRVGFGLFGNHAYLAAYLLWAIGFCLLVLIKRYFKSIWLNVFLGTAAVFLTITLIWTQIRGAYFGLAAAILLFLVLIVLFYRQENKKLSFWAASFLLLGTVALITIFLFRDSAWVKNQPLLRRVTEISRGLEVSSIKERILTWQIAWQGFCDKPVFGWGPENFGAVNNKYYNFRVGEEEPWFDRAHNQVLDILVSGGLFLFCFYLFWLVAVIYLIWRIAQKEKILGFLLAGLFLAYFGQGLFLFDTIAAYLGLFPFLAFLVFENNQLEQKTDLIEVKKKNNQLKIPLAVLIPIGVLIILLIYLVSFLPYRANYAFWQFYNFNANHLYQSALPFLNETFNIRSPYTFWEVRKRAGWELRDILGDLKVESITPADLAVINKFYDLIMPELEKLAAAHPYEQQIYYLLGSLYRLGTEKLGRNDLTKAEQFLKQGLNYSNLRLEYYNELGMVLLKQGKFTEAEGLMKDYVSRANFYDYFPYLILGHFYLVAEKYDLAMEQYDKAVTFNYPFVNNQLDYERYLVAAEQTGQYQKLVAMAEKYLAQHPTDANTYFNLAVGYWHLQEKTKAKEFYQKAVALDANYEQYRAFFEP